MNSLAIKIQQFEVQEWISGKGDAAVFYVDDVPITEFLGRFEVGISLSVQSRSRHGRWIGISPEVVLPPSRDFLGFPRKDFVDSCGGRVPLAACSECGMYWCDGIWARVHSGESVIVWTEFTLNPDSDPSPLAQVPDLEFDPTQYRAAFTLVSTPDERTETNG